MSQGCPYNAGFTVVVLQKWIVIEKWNKINWLECDQMSIKWYPMIHLDSTYIVTACVMSSVFHSSHTANIAVLSFPIFLLCWTFCYSNNSFAGATVNCTESHSDPVVFFLLFLIAFAEHNFSKVQLWRYCSQTPALVDPAQLEWIQGSIVAHWAWTKSEWNFGF